MSRSAARRLARGLMAWSCLGFSLLSALTPAQGAVLCVEPEGRVAIEGAFAAACCDDAGPAGARAPAGAVDEAGADRSGCACIDVPLASVAEQRRDDRHAGLPGPEHAFAHATPCAPVLAAPARRAPAHAPALRALPPLALERGVVLRV